MAGFTNTKYKDEWEEKSTVNGSPSFKEGSYEANSSGGFAVYDGAQNYVGTVNSDGSTSTNGASTEYKESFLSGAKSALEASGWTAGSSNGYTAPSGSASGSGSSGRAGYYTSALQKQLAALESAYKNSLLDIKISSDATEADYYEAKRQVESKAALEKLANNETMNANGLNSGAVGQAALAQSNVLQSGLSALTESEAESMASLELEKTKLAEQYRSAVAQAISDNEMQKAEALYKVYTQSQSQLLELQKAETQYRQAQLSKSDSLTSQTEESAQSFAREQVNAILKLGALPSQNLVDASGYDDSYIQSLYGYYSAKEAK